jgi:hypothetical protein
MFHSQGRDIENIPEGRHLAFYVRFVQSAFSFRFTGFEALNSVEKLQIGA